MHAFYTTDVSYFCIKNSKVHNSKSKLYTGVFKNRIR